MPRKSEPAKSRSVGRPKSRPPGASFWGVWVTAAERAALQAHLAKLRGQSK